MANSKKILVHIHLFYPEIWQDLKICLRSICSASRDNVDVYISMVHQYDDIWNEVKSISPHAHLLIVENKGWDIASFIHVINSINLDEFDYVVKLHSKRDILTSPWYIDGYDVSGSKWRTYALNFCSSISNWQKSLKTLEDESVGMVADYHVIADENTFIDEKYLEDIEKKLGIQKKNLRFSNCSIFCIKAYLLKKIQNKYNFDDFKETNINEDRKTSFPHHLEIIFGRLLEDKKLVDFARRNYIPYSVRFVALIIKNFLWHKKVTPTKISLKFLGITIYKKSRK